MALALAGCGGGGGDSRGEERPARLVDGSAASSLPSVLDHLGWGAVATHVRVTRAANLDAPGRVCLDSFRSEFLIPATTVVVQQVGVVGASLTFLDAQRRVLLGCDRTDRAAAKGPWCARSVGRLFSGRLRDPRIDILCRNAHGDRVGFGWVQPTMGVRWIVVRNGQHSEVEERVGPLPMRIATNDVDAATSTATFDVRELGRDGKEVRRYRLHAGVAG